MFFLLNIWIGIVGQRTSEEIAEEMVGSRREESIASRLAKNPIPSNANFGFLTEVEKQNILNHRSTDSSNESSDELPYQFNKQSDKPFSQMSNKLNAQKPKLSKSEPSTRESYSLKSNDSKMSKTSQHTKHSFSFDENDENNGSQNNIISYLNNIRPINDVKRKSGGSIV